ncbi:MAG: S8 family serine peptidase [Pseudomonadota bacterium]
MGGGIQTFLFLLFLSSLAFAKENLPPPLKKIPELKQIQDPLMEKAWHLKNIKAPEAWKVSKGNPDVTLAVIDSGVNYNHPELIHRIKRKVTEWPANGMDDDNNRFVDDVIGWDFVRGLHLPMDRTGHGTAMAAIMAGTLENGEGAAGVCPQCSVLPIRFINWEGLGDTEDAIDGIYYAVSEGASVINISFAGEGYDRDLLTAIRYAAKHDVVVVVASGNDGENLNDSSVYPAKFSEDNMLTVTGTDNDNQVFDGANWSSKYVSLGAPGDEVVQPWFQKWDVGSGTSQATAVVAGAVGLIRSIAPDLKASDVVSLIKATVQVYPHLEKKIMTSGILDVEQAAQCASHQAHPCLR